MLSHRRLFVSIVVAGLLAAGTGFFQTQAPAYAQDAPPPPLAPRTIEEKEALLNPWGPLADAGLSAPVLDGAQSDGGRIVFQDYRDNNWEIYSAPSVGGPAARLTADPASDLEPKLSPDMNQIVFASRRTGNYELFRMNADGGGLVQLTNSAATDSAAAWSPDGQRIAFQSNRDGDYEVFVMNAAGGNVVQLTSNGDYDGEPTWSPDGSRLAFISKRSSGNLDYYLYVMNADGSGAHVLSAVPYSSRPAWSLDGTRILFDGMGSQGWQRLFLADAASGQTSELDFFSASPNTDVMAGTWGLQNTVYFTNAHYVSYNGQWYWDSMTIYFAQVTQAGYIPDLRQGDRAAFPSWSNPDRLAPSAWMAPGPSRYARYWTNMNWHSVLVDRGPAGYGSIQVQARQDGGAWFNINPCTATGPASARCEYWVPTYAQLDFRVRGVDAFGNEAAWPEDPAQWASTTVFARLVTGSVRDQRGLGLVNVPITGIPAHEAGVVSDGTGEWVAHQLTLASDYTITAAVGGATTSRAAAALVSANPPDLRVEFILPPVDNVLANPGFDVAGAAWLADAGTKLRWLAAPYAGGDPAALQLDFQPSLSRPTGLVHSPAAVVSGTTTILAIGNDTGAHVMICPMSADCVPEDLPGEGVRDLATRSDGTTAAIVMNSDATWSFLQRSPAGLWSAPETFPYMGMGLGHTLLADSTGRWHYVWAENDGMVHVSQRQDDGSWSGASPAGSMLLGSQAVFDASDVLHIVGCPTTGVVEVTWSVADGMSIPTTVSNETCAGGFQGATIDAGGRIDAVWNADGVVRFSRRGPGGSWGAPVPLTGVTLAASGARSGPDGRATVAAAKADGSIDLYQASADGAAWEPMSSHLFPLDTVQARAVLAFNWASSSMIVHQTRARLLPTMIYVDEIVFYDVMGRQHTLGASQVVTIPADLNRPMLSTDYRYYDSAGDNVLALGIQGAADGAPTWTVLPSGLGALHGWLDVSAWAGQTVTVSLQLRDGPSANLPVAYFDLVYLASWQTPVVTGLEPAQLASAGGTLTVVGDNFIGTPIVTVAGHPVAVTRIDAQHLTITVPADLPFGRHPLLVTNPAGHATLAATSVRIGSAFLNLPALLRWAPPGSP